MNTKSKHVQGGRECVEPEPCGVECAAVESLTCTVFYRRLDLHTFDRPCAACTSSLRSVEIKAPWACDRCERMSVCIEATRSDIAKLDAMCSRPCILLIK